MVIVISTILSMIVILGLASMSGMFTEKAGIVNLSIEGFMTMGAISYSFIAAIFRESSFANQFWIMPVAGLATTVFGALYALVTIRFKANQTIAGIALNALALAISIFIIKSDLNPTDSKTKLAIFTFWWSLGENNASIGWIFNIVLFIGVPSILFLFIYLNKTKGGKMIKAAGENPHAIASLGQNVSMVQFKAIMISSFFSGIAGAMFAQRGSVFFGSTQGIGFLAVAIVIFGQWKPSLIILGALLFGGLYGISNTYQQIPWMASWAKQELVDLVPFAISLTVLIFTSKNSRAPKSIGIPYENSGR